MQRPFSTWVLALVLCWLAVPAMAQPATAPPALADCPAVARLRAAGAAVWRTDRDGEVTVRNDARGVAVAAVNRLQQITLFDIGSVQYTPEIREVAYQGRALVLMRLYSRDVASEKTGYIAEVEITDTVAADTYTAP